MRTRWIAFWTCLLFISLAQAKDFKIATVDLTKLFTEYPGTKTAQSKFNTMAKKKQQDLIDLKKEIDDKKDELDKTSSVLTKKQKKEQAYLLTKMEQDYLQKENEVMTELKNQETQMTQDVLSQIKAIVAKIAKDKGCDLVLDAEKTVYAKDSVDLTDDVLKSYKTMKADSSDSKDSTSSGDSKDNSDSSK